MSVAQNSGSSLLRNISLSDFSATSSINFYKNKFYLVSDDETSLMILNADYEKIDSILFMDQSGQRLAKAKKLDLEASAIITRKERKELWIFASASTPKRNSMFRVPLDESNENQRASAHSTYADFVATLRGKLPNLNIEGVTMVGECLVFANRGNNSSRKNHLITLPADSLYNGNVHNNLIHEMVSVTPDSAFAGVSEIFYERSINTLFMTFTQEATSDSYNDGSIGSSYVAWIVNADKKIEKGDFKADHILDLSTLHPSLKNQKIEGICVESTNRDMAIIHLVSDNDDGKSQIFKIQLKL